MRKLTREDFKRTENESPLNLYHQGIKAEETREKYTRTLRHILCKIFEDIFEGEFEERVNEFVKLARDDPKWATDLLLNLSRILRDRTKLPTDHQDYLKPVSIDNYFKPFKKLLDMNEIPLSWERIYSTFPESDNNFEGRGWTRHEIQKMLKHVNGAMERSIILVAASSATRIGGFDYTWKDVVPIYKIGNELKIDITESEEKEASVACAMLSTYKGTNAEYPSFITPEAFSAIMDYKTEWIRDIGKEPKPDQPLFKKDGDLARKLNPVAIKKRVERIVRNAGIRPPLAKGKRRYEVPLMNGFRRFCNKTLKNALSNDSSLGSLIKKEYMMGHSGLVKTDRNYFKAHVLELAEEYLNAVKDLTISDEERLRTEKIKLQKEKKEFENAALKKMRELLEEKENDVFDKIREYISWKYEGNEKERVQKRKEFYKKYDLDESKESHLKITIPPEIQKIIKNMPKPKMSSIKELDLNHILDANYFD